MFWKKVRTPLDNEIDRALLHLKGCEFGSEEYVKTLMLIQDLLRIKEEDKSRPVSRDVLAQVGANLLGILMIIKHEHVNVIVSRAMQLLIPTRIKS